MLFTSYDTTKNVCESGCSVANRSRCIVTINEPQGFCKTVISQSDQCAFCTRKWLTNINVVSIFPYARNISTLSGLFRACNHQLTTYTKRPSRVETSHVHGRIEKKHENWSTIHGYIQNVDSMHHPKFLSFIACAV